MTKITVPEEFDITSLEEFIKQLYWYDNKTSVEIDLSKLKFIRPSGLAVLAAYTQYLKVTGLFENRRTILWPNDSDVIRYLKRMDFHQMLDIKTSENFSRRNGTGKFQELYQVDNEDEISCIIGSLEQILQRRSKLSGDFVNIMRYALHEILENLFNHANSPINGVICGQSYPKLKKVQFAIVDVGIGIPKSLRSNPKYSRLSDKKCLLESIKSKVTSKPNANTGEGLFFASKIAQLNDGLFYILSLNARLEARGKPIAQDAPYWQGTIIVFEVPYFVKKSVENIFNKFAPPENDFELVEEL